jgi:choice-of-anchor B domain-containing protein
MSELRRRVPVPAVLALVVLLTAGVLATTVFAADNKAGEVSLENPRLEPWQGAYYPVGTTKTSNMCQPEADPEHLVCDTFKLTVNIPKNHWEEHGGANRGGVDVRVQPDPDSGGDDDFDIFIYDAAGTRVARGITAGGGTERAFIDNANADDGPYTIEVHPWEVSDSDYMGGAFVESRAAGDSTDIPTEPLSNVPCDGRRAGVFPCDDVDLESFLPISSISPDGEAADEDLNDIWGWVDPETGREYALVGKTNGTAFVDVTDALNPVYLGDLPSAQREPISDEPVETIFEVWRDIKVYKDHAYIVSEEPSHGVQVFDLRRLRGATEPPQDPWDEDANYSFVAQGPFSLLDPADFGDRTPLLTGDNAHNIAINEESGKAYAIGTSTCAGGGAHIMDLGDPNAVENGADGYDPTPEFVDCISDDSYTHDTQCVTYDGPDTTYRGDEICLSSNEDTLTIHRVAEDGAQLPEPEQLSRTPYDGSSYTHQGWLTPDGEHFLVGDELDEPDDPGIQTRTFVFDVTDLQGDTIDGTNRLPPPEIYNGRTQSIDHNMYTKGDEVFQANYRSGLEILDTSALGEGGELEPTAFFDTYPEDNRPEFNGAWSNYPYLPSGNVVVSSIEEGLFVLRPRSAGPRSGSGDGLRPGGAGQGGGTTPNGGADQRGSTGQPRNPCFTPATQARKKRIGRAGLGNRRSNVRRTFGAAGRYRRFLDRYCLADESTIRVGYPSFKQMRRLVARERRRLRGKASLVLTSSRRSTVRGINVGDSVRELRRKTGNRRGVHVGKNVWYVRRGQRAGHVFKVQNGVVREVGLADRKQTATNARVKRFFTSDR